MNNIYNNIKTIDYDEMHTARVSNNLKGFREYLKPASSLYETTVYHDEITSGEARVSNRILRPNLNKEKREE